MYATVRIAFNSGVGHLILNVLEQLRVKMHRQTYYAQWRL
jgi:hypothetical protein